MKERITISGDDYGLRDQDAPSSSEKPDIAAHTPTAFRVRRNRSGFSLMELLVAVSVLLVLGGTILPLFTAGWEAWGRSVRTAGLAYDSIEWMEILASDLRSAVVIEGMAFPDFEGGADSLSLIRPAEFSAGERELVRVRYARRKGGVLERERTPLAWGGNAPPVRLRRAHVGEVEFSYAENIPGGMRWSDAWPGGTNLPAAVQVAFSGRGGGKQLVLLPPGPCLPPASGMQSKTAAPD